jgi:membrane protein YdbS with pleckstrin-like domain
MVEKVFQIRSILVQNVIMLSCLGVVLAFLIHSFMRKNKKAIILFTIWLFLVLWFFNSPFFGFSMVGISQQGIRIQYGIISFRNTLLPLDTQWRIESQLAGIRKNRRLYELKIGTHRSMRVTAKELSILKEIGKEIDKSKRSRDL